MLKSIAKLASELLSVEEISAHCDGPCGVYDPADARIKAEAVLSMTKKILALEPPAAGDAQPPDPPDFAPVRRLDGHTNGITHLLAAPDGTTLISSSLDRTLRLWDTAAEGSGSAEAILDSQDRARQIGRAHV